MTVSTPATATEPMEGIRAAVFDAYGTLFDVHAPAARLKDRIGSEADALSATWRTKQLEYTWLRSLMGRHADFRRVTAEALDFAFEAHGLERSTLQQELLDLYDHLDAYPDALETLRTLRGRGMRTAILSNGSPDMLHRAVDHAGLTPLLDHVLSVEDVGIFKPDRRTYQLAVDRMGVPASGIAFLSSNGWDVAGAAAFGFRTVWVNRFGRVLERLPSGPERVVHDLSPLARMIAPTDD